MANIASAKKRARQSEKRRQLNASQKSTLRSSLKKVATASQSKDKNAVSEAVKNAVPVVDRMAKNGIIHKNKAARHKRQMNQMLRNA